MAVGLDMVVSLLARFKDELSGPVQSAGKDAEKSMEDVGEKAGGIGDKVKNAFESMAGALAAYFSMQTFMGLIEGAAAASDEMTKLMARTGLASDELGRLEYAAAIGESDVNSLALALKMLSRSMIEAQAGGGKGYFKELGVSLEDTEGKMKRPLDMFFELGERLGSVSDQAKLSAYSMALLGRGADEIAPILANLNDLKKNMAEADEIGYVQSEEALRKQAEMGDSLDRLSLRWKALKTAAATAAMDGFKPMLDMIGPMVTSFAKLTQIFSGIIGPLATTTAMIVGAGGLIYALNSAIATFTSLNVAIKFSAAGVGIFAVAMVSLQVIMGKIIRETDELKKKTQSLFDSDQRNFQGQVDRYKTLAALRKSLALATEKGDTGEQARLQSIIAPKMPFKEGTSQFDMFKAAFGDGKIQPVTLANIDEGLALLRGRLDHNRKKMEEGAQQAREKDIAADTTSWDKRVSIIKEALDDTNEYNKKVREIQDAAEKASMSATEAAAAKRKDLLEQINDEAALESEKIPARKAIELQYQKELADARKAGSSSAAKDVSQSQDKINSIIMEATKARMGEEERLNLEYLEKMAEIDRLEGATFSQKERAKAEVAETFLYQRQQREAEIAKEIQAVTAETWAKNQAEEEAGAARRGEDIASRFLAMAQWKDGLIRSTQTGFAAVEQIYRDDLAEYEKHYASMSEADRERLRAVIENNNTVRRMQEAARQADTMGGIKAESDKSKIDRNFYFDPAAKQNMKDLLDLLNQIEMKKWEIALAGAAGDTAGFQAGAAELENLLQKMQLLSTMSGPNLYVKALQDMAARTRELIPLIQELMIAMASGDSTGIASALAAITAKMAALSGASGKMAGDVAKPIPIMKQLKSVAGATWDAMSEGLGNAAALAMQGSKSFGEAVREMLKALAIQEAVLAIVELAKGFGDLFFNPPAAAAHFKSAALHAVAAGMAGGAAAAAGGGGGGAGGGGGSAQQSGPRDYTTQDLDRIRGRDITPPAGGGATGAAAGGGAPVTLNVHYNVSGIDANSIKSFVYGAGSHIAGSLKSELSKNPQVRKQLGQLVTGTT